MPARAGPARRTVRTFLVAAFLVLSAGGAASTRAEEGLGEPSPAERPFEPPGEPTGSERPVGPAQESPPEEGLIEAGMEAAGKAMDVTHAAVQRNILDSVIWFDEFFGTARADETRQTEYLLRVTNAVRYEEGGEVLFRAAVRAHLRLPKISRRFKLVVSGESEIDPATPLPQDPGNPGFDRTTPATRLVNAEVQYRVLDRPSGHLFFGAGIRLRIPPDPFVRTRGEYTRRFGDILLARLAETLFWRDDDGFGETTEITLERQIGRRTVLRWANAGTLAERTEGLEWGTELSLQRQLSLRSAATFAGTVNGDTDPSAKVDVYRVLTRYRRNFLRKWLFLELEPEIFWPRNAGGGYPSTLAFTFRIEILFQGSDAAKEARPPRVP